MHSYEQLYVGDRVILDCFVGPLELRRAKVVERTGAMYKIRILKTRQLRVVRRGDLKRARCKENKNLLKVSM